MISREQLKEKHGIVEWFFEKSEMRSVETPKNSVILLAGVVVAGVLTLLDVNFYYHMAVLIAIFAGVAVSLDILSGYAGQVSIAHAAFMAVGAYTSAILTVDYGFPIWAGVALGGVLAMLVGIVLGFPAFRTEGHYFVLVTIAIAILAIVVLNIWTPVTGGPNGILGIPRTDMVSIAGIDLIDFGTRQGYFYLVTAYLLSTIVVANNILDSRIGRTYIAVRDNESLAKSHGINTKYAKLSALGVSCFFAGIGGGLYAHYLSFINPEMFEFFIGFEILVMLIIGGLGSLIGAVIGAFVIVVTPELLRGYPDVSLLVFGLILLFVVLFFPGGIWGFITKYTE